MGQEICFLSIADLSELVRKREVSPVEVVQAHLGRIDELDGKLNSFITLLKDESLKAAQEAEKAIRSNNYLGPLHGIPIGLKDLYYTKGILTTAGSGVLSDFVPKRDATVVERLKKAGAIIIGKLNMDEFARGATNENPHFGPCHNPWDLQCVTGGSSGGSGAAVSAGLCMGALGSDTGGSVRIPASLCGIVGLKPTYGLVSRYGVVPLSWTLDHVGPMTRTVQDNAIMMNVMAGYDPQDPASSDTPMPDLTQGLEEGIKGLRLGILKEISLDGVDSEVRNAVNEATTLLERLGASVEEVSVPLLSYSDAISSAIVMGEASAYHAPYLKTRPEGYGARVRARNEAGLGLLATQYIKAQRARTLLNQQMNLALKQVDALVTPTSGIGAPQIGQKTVKIDGTEEPILVALAKLTRTFNITGTPAISIPCGFTSAGLPIGLQLIGRPFHEATLFKVAHAYESNTDWHNRRPSP